MSDAAVAKAYDVNIRSPHFDSETTMFFNWLLTWIVLPNLPFLPITLAGGPPRFAAIAIGALVGLFARRFPYPLRVLTFIALITYFVLSFISSMFNMSITMIMSVAGLIFDMSPATSMEYVVGAILMTITCGIGLYLLRRPAAFSTPKWVLCAGAVIISVTAADIARSLDTLGSYTRIAPADAPFSSASKQTNLLALADGKTNLMVVVVEAMGQPNDAALRDQLDKIWARPELAAKFEITRGQTPFFGSTTNGEMRELCYRWADYEDVDGPQPDCLPALLAKRGYQTTSYHAFSANFFNRDNWYPLIGFQDMVFGETMLKHGARFCPNVFPGACDRDVPAIIGKRLAHAEKPQFIYWLTLNSHLPIVQNSELGTESCNRIGDRLSSDFPMICRLFAIWGSTADALTKLTQRADFPPTDILIVGDHMPPFTHQQSRLQFDAEHVPWVLLRYKTPPTTQ